MPRESEMFTDWLSKADDDLRLADLAISAKPPVWWGAAFHAQQAAEKSLKALLMFHHVKFAKSHNLDYLVDLCVTVAPALEQLRESANKLTDYAVEPRYPFFQPDATEAEAAEAIEIARDVRRIVREALHLDLGGQGSGP